MTATMESLIGLVNNIQRACTALGDHDGDDSTLSSLWDALPSVAIVGGQTAAHNNYANDEYAKEFGIKISPKLALLKLGSCRLRGSNIMIQAVKRTAPLK